MRRIALDRTLALGAGLGAVALMALALRRRRRAAAAQVASAGPSLDAVNQRFHQAYDEARQGEQRSDPVLVVLADSLILVQAHHRHEERVTPSLFHVIKSVAHAPIALFSMAHQSMAHQAGRARASASSTRRLAPLRARCADALRSLEKQRGEEALLANLRHILQRTIAAIDDLVARALADGAGTIDGAALDRFARELGPALLRSTADATRLQLAALDQHARSMLARLDSDERRRLHVVVTGDHQARVRSLAMQYFKKLFDEPAALERRVTYGEGVSTVDEALALVGTRRLDRAIAEVFFADSDRLQRDILGDAAHELLQTTELARLG